MKVYVLIHKQDSSVWDADAELFLSMEQAQEAMRNAWNEALKAWELLRLIGRMKGATGRVAKRRRASVMTTRRNMRTGQSRKRL